VKIQYFVTVEDTENKYEEKKTQKENVPVNMTAILTAIRHHGQSGFDDNEQL